MNEGTPVQLPPHNREAENGLIAALIIDGEEIYNVLDILPDEKAFFMSRHKRAYGAMLTLIRANQPIDTITVATEMGRDGKGEYNEEMVWLIGITTETYNVYNAPAYAERIAECYKRRQIIQAANEMAKLAYDKEMDIADVTNGSQSAAIAALDESRAQQAQTGGAVLQGVIELAEAARLGNFAPTLSLPWGAAKRIRAVRGAMVALGARPAMGKTSFLLQWIRHVAEQGHRVMFFSLEMTANEVMGRMVMQATGLDEKRVLGMEGFEPLTDSELTTVYQEYEKINRLQIVVDDTASLHIDTMVAKCRAEQLRHGGDLVVFVDYLQYVDGGGKNTNRYELVTEVSRKLKQIAKDVGWVIVAAQLSRAVESRQDKRPQLSDLRESGQIEQDSNIALALYRDEYYYPDTTERPNIAELLILKNRAGTLGTVDLFWKGDAVRFADLAKEVRL